MRKLPLVIFILLSALSLTGRADTVTLKDGSTVEGKITQESDTQITVTVQVTSSIVDEQVIKRENIDKIEKTPEDGIAFEQLKALKPDPWAMMPAETYKGIIDRLLAFQEKYPQSSHKADVQAMLATFQEEQRHQQAGEVKLYGLWIPAGEAAGRTVQIQAQSSYLRMKSLKFQGDMIGALNEFDRLEKAFPNARVYPMAVDDAKKLLPLLLDNVNRSEENLKITTAQWTQGVALAREPEKSQELAAHQAELDQYDAMQEAATKSGLKWPPFIPKSQKSLDALLTELASEKTRLAALAVDKMNASIQESDKASEAISSNDLGLADTHLKTAITLWPVNEEAAYLQKYVTDKMAEKTADPEHRVKVAAVVTRPTPQVAGTVATPTPTPKPKPVSTPVGPTPTPEPAEKPGIVDFFFTIPGAITIVVCAVLLLVGLSFLQKMSKNKAKEE